MNRVSLHFSFHSSCLVFLFHALLHLLQDFLCLVPYCRVSVVRADYVNLITNLKWTFLEFRKKHKVLTITHMFLLPFPTSLMPPLGTLWPDWSLASGRSYAYFWCGAFSQAFPTTLRMPSLLSLSRDSQICFTWPACSPHYYVPSSLSIEYVSWFVIISLFTFSCNCHTEQTENIFSPAFPSGCSFG